MKITNIPIESRQLVTVRTLDSTRWPDFAGRLVRIELSEVATPEDVEIARRKIHAAGAVAVKVGTVLKEKIVEVGATRHGAAVTVYGDSGKWTVRDVVEELAAQVPGKQGDRVRALVRSTMKGAT